MLLTAIHILLSLENMGQLFTDSYAHAVRPNMQHDAFICVCTC